MRSGELSVGASLRSLAESSRCEGAFRAESCSDRTRLETSRNGSERCSCSVSVSSSVSVSVSVSAQINESDEGERSLVSLAPSHLKTDKRAPIAAALESRIRRGAAYSALLSRASAIGAAELSPLLSPVRTERERKRERASAPVMRTRISLVHANKLRIESSDTCKSIKSLANGLLAAVGAFSFSCL